MSCSRCDRLAAQIADLQLELEAWRGNARDDEAEASRRVRGVAWRAALGLSFCEAAVLDALLARPGMVVGREQLAQATRGLPGTISSLDVPGDKFALVYVHKLRKKLASVGLSTAIQTVWGIGYFLAPDKAAALEDLVRAVPAEAA